MNTLIINKHINHIHVMKDTRGVYTLEKAVGNFFIKKTYYYFTQREALKDFTAYVKLESGVM